MGDDAKMDKDQSDRIRKEAQFTAGYLVWLADQLTSPAQAMEVRYMAHIRSAAAEALRWVAEGVRVSPYSQPYDEGR